MLRYPSLFIGHSQEKGRGIFTSESIPADTIIELAPVITMTAAERRLLDQTRLHDYLFEWGEDRSKCAMALGWIPIFNHAVPANCEYFMDFDEETIFIKTVREIVAGEELFVNYKGDFDNTEAVWFQAK